LVVAAFGIGADDCCRALVVAVEHRSERYNKRMDDANALSCGSQA
jgi:hypothetical protein